MYHQGTMHLVFQVPVQFSHPHHHQHSRYQDLGKAVNLLCKLILWMTTFIQQFFHDDPLFIRYVLIGLIYIHLPRTIIIKNIYKTFLHLMGEMFLL
jgi:hypothetical protein